jgi:hypothetical protein
MTRPRYVCALIALSACLNKTPPPAVPDDLQQNVRWFWTFSDDATDMELVGAAQKLIPAAHPDTWMKALEGQSTAHLTTDDVKGFVTDKATDPSPTRPLLVVNRFSCTQAQLEKVILNGDQATLYPGSYDKYVRTDDYDRAAFDARKLNFATWSEEVDNTFPVNDSYTSTVGGSLRRVPKDGTTLTNSDMLVARTWLPAPATFSASSSSYYRQDYEIEMFWETSPGTMFHVYGMWRDIKDGSFNVTLDDNGFMNLVLDNLVKWDGKTEKLCPMQ